MGRPSNYKTLNKLVAFSILKNGHFTDEIFNACSWMETDHEFWFKFSLTSVKSVLIQLVALRQAITSSSDDPLL